MCFLVKSLVNINLSMKTSVFIFVSLAVGLVLSRVYYIN